MKTVEQPELMTCRETAEYLRIPEQTVYYLVKKGKLPAVHIGGRIRIKRSRVDSEILQPSSDNAPAVLVLIENISLRDLVVKMLHKCGYDVSLRRKHDVVIVCPDSLDVFPEARQKSPEATICLLWGEPCPEALRTLLQYGPVTLLHHPVTLESIQKLASMFKVEPVALVA